jgi:hypothetical protein
MGPEPLVCPSCATPHPLEDRFCRDCGMPLVYAGMSSRDERVTAAHEHARKIKPQLSEGELVRVAGGRNQAEAELIQNILIEEGVPSILRRTAGFDVPDFLAAGPRDVYVPESGAELARELLREAAIGETIEPVTNEVRGLLLRLLIVLVGALAAALIAWLASGGAT